MYVSIYIRKAKKKVLQPNISIDLRQQKKKHTQKKDSEKFMTLKSHQIISCTTLAQRSRALSDVASYQWLEHKVILRFLITLKGHPRRIYRVQHEYTTIGTKLIFE